MSCLYLYALSADGRASGTVLGLSGEPVQPTPVLEFTAWLGAIPSTPGVTADGLRAHDTAVRNIAALSDAVLPARFGTVVSDVAQLAEELRPRTERLSKRLALVGGREQMTLRVFWSSGKPKLEGQDASSGTAWLRERARRLKLPELDSLRKGLEGLVVTERVEAGRRGEMAMRSVYHLIPRGASADYVARVAAWRSEDVRAVPSGPWPAYAFADIGEHT